jgi:hypothetical protein
MKRACLPVLIGMLVLSGCARHYVLKLTNGAEITTASKPRLKDGAYHFKDAKGEEHIVPQSRVRELVPRSIAREESKPKPVKSGPPRKRKWYLLWLG